MFSRLKDSLVRCRILKPILPAVVIGGIVAAALSGYESPVYEAKVPEINVPSESASTAPALTLPETTALPEEARTNATPAAGAMSSLDAVDDSDATYKDGVYKGSAQGFGGPITVQVTIKDGAISDITVLSASGETPEYFSKAKSVIQSILNGQSTNVDVVSGATYSSNGIIQAVRNALRKAETNGKTDSTDPVPASSNKSAAKTKTPADKKTSTPKKLEKVDESDALYKDGTYSGSAEGFGGTISVNVTISNGKITNIQITEAADETPEYLDLARVLTDTITKKQSTNVDAISGATYSSNGIIGAVRDALSKALIKPATDNDNASAASDTTPGQTDPSSDTPTVPAGDPAGDSTGDSGEPGTDTDTGESQSLLFNDGIYPVNAWVYYDEDEDFDDYELYLSVTIKNDQVQDITIDESNTDTDKTNMTFSRQALRGLAANLIGQSSCDGVDTVSGATCSSKAILECVTEALTNAKK